LCAPFDHMHHMWHLAWRFAEDVYLSSGWIVHLKDNSTVLARLLATSSVF